MKIRCDWCKQFVSKENALIVERGGRELVFCKKPECRGAQAQLFDDYKARETTRVVTFRTENEHVLELEKQAKQNGMTLSSYVRKLVLAR